MSFHSHKLRLRISPATQRRDDNVRKIIAAMRERSMLRNDIMDLLGSSPSGTNKYIALLRESGVIELERYVDRTRNSPGQPLYRLNHSPVVVADYLQSIERGAARVEKHNRPAAKADQSRHIHRIPDDGGESRNHMPELRIPPPDPVLAAFFGLNQTQAAA